MRVLRDQPVQPRRIVTRHILHDIDTAMRREIANVMTYALAHVFLIEDWLKRDHGKVAAALKSAILVDDVGDAARHAGGEIAPGAAEHRDHATRHVFAAMIAGAFDHG